MCGHSARHYPGETAFLEFHSRESSLDMRMIANWHEKHILLKVAFPLSAHN